MTLVALLAALALADGGKPIELFNGKDLSGWEFVGVPEDRGRTVWTVENGALVCRGEGGGWISTGAEHDDFELDLEYRLADGANSGVYLRAPRQGRISSVGIEIQIIDEHSPRYNDPKHPKYYALQPYQRTGAVYGVQPPSKTATKPAGEWNRMVIHCQGRRIKVAINGQTVVDANLDDYPQHLREHPGLLRKTGYIGLSSHNDRVEFRNVRLKDL